MLKKLGEITIKPIIGFCRNFKTYWNEKNYIMIGISFLLSLILFGLMIAVIILFIISILILGSRHIGAVTIIGGITLLYLAVYDKYAKDQSLQVAQDMPPMIDQNLALLHNYAQNGYRDMRLIVFKTLKAIGEIIGFTSPHMLLDIECLEKYYINSDCIFYNFNIKKADITKTLSDEELDDDIKILQDTFCDLWKKGEFPNVVLQTYVDNSGVILPPVSFCLMTDLGTHVELLVTYSSPAYVAFLKGTELEQSITPNNGYDMNDSHML